MPKPCPHKHLKKQMSGQQVWYVCECGQKFKAQLWDGKVRVVSPAGTGQPDSPEELAREIVLVNRADGVDGHYCIGRDAEIGRPYMEFWNPHGWFGSGYLFTDKKLADAVAALLRSRGLGERQ